MRACYNCGSTSFVWENEVNVCQECFEIAPEEIQLECDSHFTQAQTTRSVRTKETQDRPTKEIAKKPEWVIYDGFNIILSHMTKSLVECGIEKDVCDTVFGLWGAYLHSLGVGFCQHPIPENQDNENKSGAVEEETTCEAIPDWMLPPDHSKSLVSENLADETDADNDYRSEYDDLPFVPYKIGNTAVRRKKQRRKSMKEDLISVPDSELSGKERARKRRMIKNSFLSLSCPETGDEAAKAESEVETDCESTRSGYSRRRSLVEKLPECFPETESSDKFGGSHKISDVPSSRTVLPDPEYLTLAKLLSFLHGALILRREKACHSDIIRWIREGWIPFHGSHQFLPQDTMPLSRTDTSILGGVTQKNSWVPPLSSGIRRNTAKILVMTGVSEVKLPPIRKVAEKIIKDLQLPDEFMTYVAAIERMAFHSRGWRTKKIGDSIPNVESHAAAIILVVMKLLFGLDESSEFKISEFAEKANQILKLEPATKFPQPDRSPANSVPQYSGKMKTLFVWEEWVRWIRYRRFILDRTHVPTAVQHNTVSRMDPNIVIHFAKSRGHFLSHRKKTRRTVINASEEIKRIIDDYVEKNQGYEDEKPIPTFRPCLLPVQGLAEQLLEFDSEEYALLNQKFSDCSLAYLIDQGELAAQLKKAETPAALKIFHGPAISSVELRTPFMCRQKKHTSKMPPLRTKDVKLKTGPVNSAGCLSDDDDDASQSLPSLLLHLPSSAYWVLSAVTDHSKEAWELVSSQLSSTFLWLLELISESIEEEPQLVYQHTYAVETMVFQRHAKLSHSLIDQQELKRRLVATLLSDINRR